MIGFKTTTSRSEEEELIRCPVCCTSKHRGERSELERYAILRSILRCAACCDRRNEVTPPFQYHQDMRIIFSCPIPEFLV